MSDNTNAAIKAAKTLAELAHLGKTRMDGVEPYINHPRRVAEAVRRDTPGPKRMVAVSAAWLHDVVEDTAVTFEILEGLGFNSEVIRIVEILTRREDETHAEYLDRVAASKLATAVKIADMRDNLASLPEGHSLRKRYEKGLERLGAS